MTAAPLDLTAFAHHFHALIDYTDTEQNTVSSTLGAWLLLTQLAGPNPDALSATDRQQIETWLGCEVDVAYALLQNLLADIPAPVKLALQTWLADDFAARPDVTAWRENLGLGNTAITPIPSKAALDAWADEKTLGIIPNFPVDESALPDAVAILANAIATKIKWNVPFEEEPNTIDRWQVESLLAAGDKHRIHLVRDDDDNLYAVVANNSPDGLIVNAVIAEDPNLSPQHVLAFAEKYTGAGYISAEPAATLPLDSRIHTITTIQATTDRYTAVLPAWTANSTHDLLALNMPFPKAVKALTTADLPLIATQVAKAEYNKLGFEAAAISTLVAMRGAAPMRQERRLVEVSFTHPFAVVASYQQFRRTRDQAVSPWQNLPLFSAWVQSAAPVSDKDFA